MFSGFELYPRWVPLVVWLKSMDFVTQTDAAGVGNNLPYYKNVLQAMVSNPFM